MGKTNHEYHDDPMFMALFKSVFVSPAVHCWGNITVYGTTKSGPLSLKFELRSHRSGTTSPGIQESEAHCAEVDLVHIEFKPAST